jgi:hypothetical protein
MEVTDFFFAVTSDLQKKINGSILSQVDEFADKAGLSKTTKRIAGYGFQPHLYSNVIFP